MLVSGARTTGIDTREKEQRATKRWLFRHGPHFSRFVGLPERLLGGDEPLGFVWHFNGCHRGHFLPIDGLGAAP